MTPTNLWGNRNAAASIAGVAITDSGNHPEWSGRNIKPRPHTADRKEEHSEKPLAWRFPTNVPSATPHDLYRLKARPVTAVPSELTLSEIAIVLTTYVN